MKLHFLGANRQVTGSRYCLEVADKQILIDCGLFQERHFEARNWDSCPIPAAEVDAVLLTHAHIDHSGLLPKLVRNGFAGRIFATRGTIDLCSYMLPDAGSIQESEVATLNRRNAARGRAEVIRRAGQAVQRRDHRLLVRHGDHQSSKTQGPGGLDGAGSCSGGNLEGHEHPVHPGGFERGVGQERGPGVAYRRADDGLSLIHI